MSILWNIDKYAKVVGKPLGIITTGTESLGNGVYKLKAGTPISSDGEVANSSDAKYLVAEDFFFYSNTPSQAKIVKVIETGYVDLAAAEAAAGITYEDNAKAALAAEGIILVDGALNFSPADELPPIPDTDGEYVLTCTIDNGEAVLTWEDQSI